jgi:hypothetical protein
MTCVLAYVIFLLYLCSYILLVPFLIVSFSIFSKMGTCISRDSEGGNRMIFMLRLAYMENLL